MTTQKPLSKIRVISPQSNGTYYDEKASLFDKFCVGDKTGILRMVDRTVVHAKAPAVRFHAMGDLLNAEPPTPRFDNTEMRMLVGHEDPMAVTYDPDPDKADRIRREAQILNKTTRNGVGLAARAAVQRQEKIANYYLIAAIAAAIVTGLFALVVVLFFIIPRFSN